MVCTSGLLTHWTSSVKFFEVSVQHHYITTLGLGLGLGYDHTCGAVWYDAAHLEALVQVQELAILLECNGDLRCAAKGHLHTVAGTGPRTLW